MDICTQIKAARDCGVVHCAYLRGSLSLVELAEHSGLDATPESYREIPAATARRLAIRILTHDLAYQCELVTPAIAERLVETYLAAFAAPGHRCFTNVLGDPSSAERFWLDSWAATTRATFDAGVLIVVRSSPGFSGSKTKTERAPPMSSLPGQPAFVLSAPLGKSAGFVGLTVVLPTFAILAVTDLEAFAFTSLLLLVDAPFRRHEVAQLEFETRVPCVLDEPEAE